MNAIVGWALAVAAIAIGYAGYGWRGVVLALTVIVFWLLLQFGRAVRVMRHAGQSPVGHVDSAVMLQARLKPGMRLLDIVLLTKALGQRVGDTPEVWRWADAGGVAVEATLRKGRLSEWRLLRPEGEAP